MAWGSASTSTGSAVAPWVARLTAQDPLFQSLVILSFRKLSDEDVEALCAALTVNTVLTELQASGHALTARAAAAYGRMLGANKSLRTLALGNAALGADGLQRLLDAGLARNTGLQDVNLSLKGLEGPAAGAALAQLLLALPTLRALHVSRNALGLDGLGALVAGMLGISLALTALHLADCAFPAAALPAIANVLRAAPALEILVLSRNALEATPTELHFASLAHAVATHPTLTTLELEECSLAAGDAAELARALAASSAVALRHLSLSGNEKLGNAGVRALVASWLSRPAGKDAGVLLSVAQCGLDCDSLVTFVGATAVSTLRLFGNEFGLKGMTMQHVAALGALPALVDLDFGGNELPEAFVKELLEALVADHGLLPRVQVLGLGGNRLDKAQVEALQPVLERLQDARPQLQIAV